MLVKNTGDKKIAFPQDFLAETSEEQTISNIESFKHSDKGHAVKSGEGPLSIDADVQTKGKTKKLFKSASLGVENSEELKSNDPKNLSIAQQMYSAK